MNLYTSKKPKTPQYVDNMVDNVDNPLWISLTVFVHTCVGGLVLTRGKSLFSEVDLQEILPDFMANLCSDADKTGFSAEFRRNGTEQNSEPASCEIVRRNENTLVLWQKRRAAGILYVV